MKGCKERKISLAANSVLYGMKGMLNVLFPLITFPYVSRVLGVENLGKYSYASSIVSYFLLFAGLGINTYAVREGAKNKNNINEFVKQIFTINIYSTLASYFMLGISIIIFPKVYAYKQIILILSLQILFTTIGAEWLYTIYEDFFYITLRSTIVQILSLIMLYLFVKENNHVNRYAFITVVANAGSNVFSFLHVRTYCKIGLTFKPKLKKHLKPIMILFVNAMAITVYVSTDTTILGILCGEYAVGIYSVSAKIYKILKSVLCAAITVSIPRLCSYLGENNLREFNNLAENTYKTFLTIILPAIIGLIMLRRSIVAVLAGKDYVTADTSLMILGIALFFCLGAGFWSQCILIPMKKENIVLFTTVMSAIVNLVLNLLFIPVGQENAAAATTLISEIIVFFVCRSVAHKYCNVSGLRKTLSQIIPGCIAIVLCIEILKQIKLNDGIFIVLSIILSILFYIGIEVLLGNNIILNIMHAIKQKVIRA